MVRILPFKAISVCPCRAASTVIYRTSLTRMPEAQMVSISRASRSRPRVCAVLSRRSYSSRLSSREASRNIRLWIFRNFTRQSSHPTKRKKALIAASMELMVTGA